MKKDFLDTRHLSNTLGSRTVRGGAALMMSQGIRLCLQIGSTAVLTRLLVPDEFGVFGMVQPITMLLILFQAAGLSTATIQKETLTHEQVSNLLWVNVAFSFILGVILVLCAPLIASFYHDERLIDISMFLAPSIMIGGLAIQHMSLLRRQMMFREQAIIDVCSMIFSVAVAITMAYSGFSYWSLVCQPIAKSLGECVLAWTFCTWRPSLPSRKSNILPMLAFGGNLTISSFMSFFARQSDKIIIGRFLGTEPLGFYVRAYGLLMNPLTQIRTPISNLLLPALSSIQNDPERYRRTYLRSMTVVNLIAVFMMPVFISCADWIIRIVMGEGWGEAAKVFSALSLAAFTEILQISPQWLFTSQGRGGDFVKFNIINAVVAVGSFFIGLQWGIFGVAMSYSISGLLIRTPAFLYLAGRSGPVSLSDLLKNMAPYMLLFLVNVGLIYLMRTGLQLQNPFFGVILALALNTAIVCLVVVASKNLRGIVMEVVSAVRRKKG